MRPFASWPVLVACCFAAAVAPAGDAGAPALAPCDSLFAAAQFAEAAACAQSRLDDLDAGGEGASPAAAETLVLLLRARLMESGRSDPACAALSTRLLDLVRVPPGSRVDEFARALFLSGQVAERAGDFNAAREAYAQSLDTRTSAGLPDDVELANCLIAFANVRARLGDYNGLGGLYERALAIAAATTGPRSALAAKVLTNHAIFKKITGDYAAARELHERTLGIQIGLHGEQHPDVARTYYNLGNLLVESGEYGIALDRYRTSLAIREKTLGPDSADTARSLTALALAEKHLADFLPALEHAERAVTILRGQSLERHPQSADALTALASIQSDLGDLDAARASLEQALTIYERAYGPDHLRVGQVIGELGMLGQLAGDLPASLASYRRARSIYEAIDPDNDRVAGILNVEAALLAQMGRLREARDLAARSVANRERALSPDHPALGWSLATLGRCLWLGGETARAQTVLLRALTILGPGRGEVHPIYLAARYDLACVRRLRGATDVALDLALTVERGRRESVRATMSGLPERLALIYASRWPNGLDLAVDIASTGAAATPAVASVWEDLLKSRALVLDEMAWRRRTVAASGATAADSLQQALAAATRELAGALVRSWRSDGTTGSDEPLLDLRDRRDRIERRIAGLGPRRRAGERTESITLSDVAAALPADAALVGFVRFERQRKPASDGAPAPPDPAYAAFVLPVGRRAPVVVALGDAASIDNLIRGWRDEAGLGRRVPGRDVAAATAACRRVGADLRARIWDPLSPHLAGARRVYVVPDGPLHLVNLAALPSGTDRYLIDDDRPLVYLGAERDLLDAAATGDARGELLALGAPDFSANRAPIAFAPLPAAADEVREVAALWRRSRRVAPRDDAVRALLGRDASEAAFKTLAPGYRALHVATHGFFLDDGVTTPGAGQRGVGGLQSRDDAAPDASANPMLRSGLVLTGDAAGSGPDGEDGILTAAEIAALDLGDVGWVVLSACESGVGVTQAGEGVFGLRRAFRIAGARGLVISLWPLEDERIRDWMLQLYGAHLSDRLELVPAAWQASRAVLAARRAAGQDTHPQTWAAFIACGD